MMNMENMENNVQMDENVVATEEVATGSNLGGKILGGVIVAGAIVGVGTLARKGYKWLKGKIQAKKAQKAIDEGHCEDIIVEEHGVSSN